MHYPILTYRELSPEDQDDLRREFAKRTRVCPECDVKGGHMPNCPGDPENEPQEDEE